MTMNIVSQSLSGLPSFLEYFVVGLLLFGAFLAVYGWVTPYNERALIREGNVAAAISLSGAILGFMLPLASATAHSVSVVDMAVWGLIVLVVQIAVFAGVSRALPQFGEGIRSGKAASATLLAALAIAVGLLNAACMTY
jgi:putative membrane protein